MTRKKPKLAVGTRSERRLCIEYQDPGALRPYRNNARVHPKPQIKQIAKSLARFGFASPVLVSDDKQILCGHARVEAAKLLGLERIPTVKLSNLTAEEQRAYTLADNRLAEGARWDRDLLAIELEELTSLGFDEVELTGFSLGDIDLRIEEAAEKKGREQGPEDAVPPLHKQIVTRPGELWRLGPHRLVCGDATDGSAYDRLMDGEKADLVLTDPPWNLPTKYFSGKGRYQHGDFATAYGEKSETEFTEFLSSFLGHTKAACRSGCIAFVFIDWRHLYELLTAVRAQQLSLKNVITWVKSNAGMGSFYRSRHELILAVKNGEGAHVNTFELGQHGRHRSNVWEYAGGSSFHAGRADELAMHPTCKPVVMLADAIRDVSRRGSIVLDPFGGSGSTLIAAEKTGRRAHLIEIEPAYCDVIIRRFQNFAGKAARLGRRGPTFDEVESTRGPG